MDISSNSALQYLQCYDNHLTNLDVSQNTNLGDLECNNNQLTALDLSYNTALVYLECSSNQLSSLDVSHNTNLGQLECSNNQLTTLDVSQNTNLWELTSSYNQLTSLDLSHNTAFTSLVSTNNQLTSLNIKNGNNANVQWFDATSNPNLTCIQVDDANAPYFFDINSYRWNKDAIANYHENCSETMSATGISKKEIVLYPNPVKDLLNFSEEVSNIKITDMSGRTIKEISVSGKSVNVANLAKGNYIITATTKAGKTINQKIIKQ